MDVKNGQKGDVRNKVQTAETRTSDFELDTHENKTEWVRTDVKTQLNYGIYQMAKIKCKTKETLKRGI